MSLVLRWVEDDERDRVALARMRAYAPAAKDLPRFQERIRSDPRAVAGDFLLAEIDGQPIGTATSLSMAMWVRGGHVWTQGVAYVGTIRTHRRGGSAEQPGIASRVMHEVLRKARDRGQAASALMPFRNSFYERFGYGAVERRHEWTLPTTLLPGGDFEGYRHFQSDDLDALAACRQKLVCRGQCDFKRTRAAWAYQLRLAEDGFVLVDRPEPSGPVRGFVQFDTQVRPDGRWHLRVQDIGYEDTPALLRALRLLSSLKDQYATCSMVLPVDLPLQRLLKESQLPHRVVPHLSAECKLSTRLQIRVLDHKVFLEAMTALPPDRRGRATVSVHETEGGVSRFTADLADGRWTVSPTEQTAQFECRDVAWSAIASGDLSASQAVAMGFATATHHSAVEALDAIAVGPAPFCTEAF
jgi:predicted acetyltransferase